MIKESKADSTTYYTGGEIKMKINKTIVAVFAAILSFSCLTGIPFDETGNVMPVIRVQAAESGTVITVNSKDGAGSVDVQSAVNNAAAGSTIKLVGSFKLDSMITFYNKKGITVDATGAVISGNADIVLNPWKAENITFKGGTWNLGNNSQFAKISSSKSIMFDSVTVTGGGTDNEGCLFVYCTDNAKVINCHFNNIKSSQQAVYVYKSADFIAAGNVFNEISGHAICVYSSERSKLLGNSANKTHGDGLKCVECTNALVSGNTVKNVRFNSDLDYDDTRGASRSGCGIMIMSSSGTNVGKAYKYNGKTYEGNTVNGTDNYGMVINLCTNTVVYKTSFTNIGTNGVHNSASSSTTIQNCTFKNCKEIGIFLIPGPDETATASKRQCKDSQITGNTIDGCGSFGIDLSMTQDIKVTGNIVKNCGDYGIYCIASKNIDIIDNDTYNTKAFRGSGINYNDKCSNIKIRTGTALTLSSSGMSLGKGETAVLKCSASGVSWRTSDSKIVTVDQKGNVKAVGTGTAWVTIRTAAGKERSCKFTIKNAPTKITLTKGILTIGVGEKYTIGSGVNDGAACSKRTYRTSNSSVVKMTRTDWQGDFVGVKPGIAYVTVRSYNGKESTCKVTVKAAPTKVTLNKTSLTLKVGQSATLSASVGNSGCALRTFRSSNNNVVAMTKTNWTGSFKAIYPGVSYVTVRTYNGKEASCKVTVIR